MNVLEKIFSSDDIKAINGNSLQMDLTALSAEELCERDVYIYGAGVIGREVLAKSSGRGFTVSGFVDANASSPCEGLPVVRLEHLCKKAHPVVIVAGRHVREMLLACRASGVQAIFPRQLPGPEMITHATYPMTLEEIGSDEGWLWLQESLADDESRQVLKDILLFRTTLLPCCFEKYAKNVSEQYFPADLVRKIDYRHFVDAGAYIGDTYLQWKKYCQDRQLEDETIYYGIEAFPDQFAALKRVVNGERAFLFANVISDVSGRTVFCSAGGTGAVFHSTGGVARQTVALDDIFAGKDISVIKADIEGDELAMIRGAEKIIAEKNPSLLVSVYHKIGDLYEIPREILAKSTYSLYLRHHSDCYPETVCYAI